MTTGLRAMPEMNDRLREVTGRDVPGIAVAITGPEGLRATALPGMRTSPLAGPASADMVCP